MINKDLSHLPKAEVVSEKKEEDRCMYAKTLVTSWAEKAQAGGPKPHAVPGTSMRHSMGGKCSRQIHYYLSGTPVTNPFDLPAYWSTGLGTAIHEWWQASVKDAFPNAESEVIVHVPKADSSGSADLRLTEEDGTTTVIELKSINGFGFKRIVESNEGPRYGDKVQLSLNAAGLKADKAVLIYLSLEAISKPRAKKFGFDEVQRIAKEFHFDKEEFLPIAKEEVARWNRIRVLDADTPRTIPSPDYPAGAVVVDPSKGQMMKDGVVTGFAWECGYCPYQLKCIEDCG